MDRKTIATGNATIANTHNIMIDLIDLRASRLYCYRPRLNYTRNKIISMYTYSHSSNPLCETKDETTRVILSTICCRLTRDNSTTLLPSTVIRTRKGGTVGGTTGDICTNVEVGLFQVPYLVRLLPSATLVMCQSETKGKYQV